MKKLSTCLAAATLTFSLSALADSLELANGDVLEGDFVGSSNGIIMFQVGDDIQAFPEADVVGLFLSSGVATREAQAETAPIVLPAGTRMVIRMTDTIDSRQHISGPPLSRATRRRAGGEWQHSRAARHLCPRTHRQR